MTSSARGDDEALVDADERGADQPGRDDGEEQARRHADQGAVSDEPLARQVRARERDATPVEQYRMNEHEADGGDDDAGKQRARPSAIHNSGAAATSGTPMTYVITTRSTARICSRRVVWSSVT